MPQYLVTASLYDNWRYYHLIEDKPKDEFLNTLARIKTPPNENMQKGIDFENDVRAVADGSVDPSRFAQTPRLDCVLEVANLVRGGLWQERVKKPVLIAGMEILLYGKADVMRREWVIDIKRTGNYEVGKYGPSIQHPLYMFCAGMPKFKYAATDEKSVWEEDYFWRSEMKEELFGKVADMLESIMSDAQFRELYLKNWETYGGDLRPADPHLQTVAAVNAEFEKAKQKNIATLKGDMRHD